MSGGSPPGGKAPTALRTIGEVVNQTGVAAHVLRYWERQVPALQPVRRAGDRRYYRAEDVALIGEIARLINDEGYTLEGAARAASRSRRIGGGGQRGATVSLSKAAGHPDALPVNKAVAGLGEGAISLARLRDIRERLHEALEKNS